MTASLHSFDPRSLTPRRDAGRLFARLLCGVFALIGLVPIAAGALSRWEPVRQWAALETARVLREQVGISADYHVEIGLWPLGLELEGVTLHADDGGAPVLTAPRIRIRPRLFSLLSGQIDVGHISLESPRLRVVIEDGELTNLKLQLPERKSDSESLPVASIAITDAVISAKIDGTAIESAAVDLDVFAAGESSLEIALRAAATSVTRSRPALGSESTGGAEVAIDDDVICQMDARVRYDEGALLVRRLSLLGVVDASPDARTEPSCELERVRTDPRRVLARLSGVRVELASGRPEQITGHVLLQVPLEVTSRYLDKNALTGWVQLSGEVDVSPRTTIPEFHGKLRTGNLGLGPYTLAAHAEADLHVVRDRLLVSRFRAGYADGEVALENVSIDLMAPGMPLHVASAEASDLTFPGLMRDVDVTPNTIVNWDLDRVSIRDFGGTLDPPRLEGLLRAETTDFEVFDRSVHDGAREHMLGVPRARLVGTFGVHGDSVRFDDMRASFGKSQLRTSVHIGYDNTIQLSVPEGSTIELADISPLVDIPLAGQLRIAVKMNGPMAEAVLTGSLGITDLWFAGFPIGDVSTDRLRFVPLVVDIERAVLQQDKSEYELRAARLDFGTDATLAASAIVKDSRLDLRDFLEMWHFDSDPRWDSISGYGALAGRVSYVLGGKGDPCKSGNLKVRGDLSLAKLEMFEESYTGASSSFDFDWFDIDASYLGMRLNVPSVVLRKGTGTLLGSVRLSNGARVHGQLIASAVPLSEVQGLGPLGERAAGNVSAEAEVSGTLDALAAVVQARVSPVRIGRSELPSSTLSVSLTPTGQAPVWAGKTACGAPKPGAFDRAQFDADRPSGVFRISGNLFGEQVRLDRFEVTRQSNKHVRGRVDFHGLDLVALSNLAPESNLLDTQPKGSLDGRLELSDLALADPLQAAGTLDLTRMSIELAGTQIEATAPARARLAAGTLDLSTLTLRTKTRTGQSALFDLGGRVRGLGGNDPSVDMRFTLQPTPLDGFVSLIPVAERARGMLAGNIEVQGSLSAPVYRGGLSLTNGAIYLRGSPQAITELDLKVGILPGELIIEQGAFSFGGGRVQLRGNAPLTGFRIGELRAFISARDISLPLASGVEATADADLRARFQPGGEGEQALPDLVGNVVLTSFDYSRPVKMSANITDLAQRGRRTEFDSYQPEGDVVRFDLNVRAKRPLTLRNNLIDASLTIEDEVLQLAGTNQRYGIRGALRISPGGRFRLTKNEFEIQQGRVRFDDPTRIAPLVDVTAVTDFRRSGGRVDVTSAPTGATASAGGDFRVTMHAHGDAETLRIDLTSQPQLAQDDIFLLLTLGLTRAELDQVQSSSLGESVALEALGALTGADQVVTEAIPVIDEFRLGSFSTRSGRTEPAITIGKRLSDRIRAFVTSGLSESRDVRSNVEVRINRKVSIEGSYDNINDISSSTLGNLGADIRWRLDFE